LKSSHLHLRFKQTWRPLANGAGLRHNYQFGARARARMYSG
jgi:hypothetical protein